MTEELKKPEMTIKDIQAKAEEKHCAVQKALVFIEEFLKEPMCGKCFPCALGSYEARVRLQMLSEGTATSSDIDVIKRIADRMFESSRCKKGKDTADFIINSLKKDISVYEAHISGSCQEGECTELIVYRIIPDLCVMCGICKDICKDNAIIGEKKKPYLSGYLPFEIAQKRCTKCGDCVDACPYAAIEIILSKEAETEPVRA